MKKLLLPLLFLSFAATGQVTFDPYVTAGYLKESPSIKKGQVARDYEGNPSQEGAPRLVYLSEITGPTGSGVYVGGGLSIGAKNFPLHLNIELAGEHINFTYTTATKWRGRTEYDFEHYGGTGTHHLRYLRFTPSITYNLNFKSGIKAKVQAGASLMAPDNAGFLSLIEMDTYAAINTGLSIGHSGVYLNLQGNFGTANMLGSREGFSLYSRRITAGISVYPRELAEKLR